MLPESYNPEASNFSLCVKNHARVYFADAAVQSEARKIALHKYCIREFKAKNFELGTLNMYFYGRKKSFGGMRDN